MGQPQPKKLEIPSVLSAVATVQTAVIGDVDACGHAPETRFAIRLALDEALANAIVYGNRLDPGKRVHVVLRKLDGGVEVHVQDQGQGFDPNGIPDPTRPDCIERSAGRGLFLIKGLVDDIAFNEQGNSICMTLHRA